MSENQLQVTAKKPATISDLISSDDFKSKVALSLPKHLTPDRFARIALTALHRTPKLQSCTRESLFQCLYDLSAMGLEPDGRRAHLIPYGDKATLIVDYKGLVELAMRSGEVASIHADVVCENDGFEYNMGQIVAHKIDFRKPRGEMYAVYVRIGLRNADEPKCEVMTKEEVEAIRKRSRSGNSGPWQTDFNEMAKKTVFRRASKWITLSPELRDNLDRSDDPLDVPSAERIARPVFGKVVEPVEEDNIDLTSPPDLAPLSLGSLMERDGITFEQIYPVIQPMRLCAKGATGLLDLTDANMAKVVADWDLVVAAVKGEAS